MRWDLRPIALVSDILPVGTSPIGVDFRLVRACLLREPSEAVRLGVCPVFLGVGPPGWPYVCDESNAAEVCAVAAELGWRAVDTGVVQGVQRDFCG